MSLRCPAGRRRAPVRPVSSPCVFALLVATVSAVVLLVLTGPRSSRAQFGGPGPNTQSAYLPTSEEAAEAVARARRAAEQGRYSEAVSLLQDAIERYADKVVSAGDGIHVSVRDYCHHLIATLPPDGLRAYRLRVDPRARELFDRAQAEADVALLKELIQRYFCSSWGDDAIDLLADYSLAYGRFDEAVAWWERLLPPDLTDGRPRDREGARASDGWGLRYPDPDVDLATVAAKRVVALTLAGRIERAYAAYRLVREHFSGARIVIAGQEEDVVHALGRLLESAPRSPVTVRTDWPTFAHDARRTGHAPQAVDIGSVQWEVALPDVSRTPRFVVQRQMVTSRTLRDSSPYHPIVTRGYVIVCNNNTVLAYRLQDGPGEADEPAWKYELAGDDMPTWRRSPMMGAAATPEFTLTAEGDYVYVQLGSSTVAPLRRQGAALDSMLVCLDVSQEGKLVWQRRIDELDTVFEGAPVVVGDRLYIASRTGGSMLQSMVRCYDARTGDLLWTRLVCESPQSGRYYDQLNASTGLLTAGGGMVFYSTNLGAVAALDGDSGDIRWIWTYERQIESYYARRSTGSTLNPAVYWDGKLFVAPADSSVISCLDAATGQVNWQTTIEALGGTGIPQLLGVVDDRLIVCGQQVIALNVDTGAKEWQAPPSGGRITPMGRGVIAGDAVYIPESTQILVLDARTGLPERPAVELLNQHHQRPGNLVVADGYLVVAGDKLAVLCEYGVLIKRYRDLLTRQPDSAVLRLRLARALEATGQHDAAIEEYRLALRYVEPGEQVEGRDLATFCRDRLYRLLVSRSKELAATGSTDEALATLREAAAVAPSRLLELQTKLTLAELLERSDAPEEALAAYQDLLGREDLRGLAVSVAENRHVRADLVIAERIDGLIKKYGREIYRPYEDEVRAARQEATGSKSLAALKELLVRYPNSEQRWEILLDVARHLMDEQRWSEAIDPLRSVAAEAPDRTLRAAAMLHLATTLERMRLWTAASEVLNALATEFGDMPLPAEFGEGTVRDYVVKRLDLEPYRWAMQREVALSPPLEIRQLRSLPEDAAVMLPEGNRPVGTAPVLAVYHSGHLQLTDASSGARMWESQLPAPPEWCGFVADNLVVVSGSEVHAFAVLSGELQWRYRIKRQGETQEETDRFAPDEGAGPVVPPPSGRIAWLSPDSGKKQRLAVTTGPGRIYVRDTEGELVALDGAEGRELWRFRPTTGRIGPLFAVGPRYTVARSDSTGRVLVIDMDGRVRWDLRLDGADWARPPTWLDSTRVCVVSGPRTVQVIDAERGQVLWQYEVEGPMERALEPIVASGGALCLLAGTELIRIDPQSGHVVWQVPLAPQPLEDAPGVCVLDQYRAFYVTNRGVLGAIDLNTGEIIWQHVLAGVYAPGAWRISLSGPYVLAYAAKRSRTQPWSPIVLLRGQDGRLVQRLVAEPTGESVRLAVLDDLALLISESDVALMGRTSRWLVQRGPVSGNTSVR